MADPFGFPVAGAHVFCDVGAVGTSDLQGSGLEENVVHRKRTAWLLVETAAVYAALALAILVSERCHAPPEVKLLPVVGLGFWFHRLYVVAHEASHRKLWPQSSRINDALGQIMLLPLMVPLRIHRKIHAFHHAHNRRDHHLSALDTYVVRGRCGWGRRVWCYGLWYVGVFAGGWFVHSLVSVVLFLCMPLRLARRVSPAFKGWRRRDQLASLAVFACGVSLHVGIAFAFGARVWLLLFGWPLLAFAWCYSLLVYIYHYGTGYGPAVREHVRSLRPSPLLRWWLLGFSDHAVHHQEPQLPWYALAARDQGADASKRQSVASAIWNQWRGPTIVKGPS
ncbi:MAG: fatty acid desaturase [Deltaproteobacteria bacterium]|nr:fatty acid desaturase [Deltaproteobacteria bacterium]